MGIFILVEGGKLKVEGFLTFHLQLSTFNLLTSSCLSQWYGSSFKKDGITYPTAEHWMMAEKARLFKDEDMLQKIIKSKSPSEAKKLGRKVKGFKNDVWLDHRYEIVKQGNLLKFAQNPSLKDFLLNTKK